MIDIQEIVDKFNINTSSILHVGGHLGQESESYKMFNKIIYIEPIPEYAGRLCDQGHEVHNIAAWHCNNMIDFYITDFDQASSALTPIEHKFNEIIKVKAQPLKDIIDKDVEIMVVDAQGAELHVLMGSNLKQFKVVICETNRRARYDGAPLKQTIIDYMEKNDFKEYKTIAHSEDKIIEDVIFYKND